MQTARHEPHIDFDRSFLREGRVLPERESRSAPAESQTESISAGDPPEEKLFSYAVVRADLAMPTGKLASQASHAFAQSLLSFLSEHPHRAEEFLRLGTSGSRVVLTARNEEEILRAKAEAERLGLPHALFVDSGHVMEPFFDGSPVVTALGLGPAPKDALRPVAKRFRCA